MRRRPSLEGPPVRHGPFPAGVSIGAIPREAPTCRTTRIPFSRGQRFGFIRFGSRVDVYLTPEARPLVAIGDVVKATQTVLAELPA